MNSAVTPSPRTAIVTGAGSGIGRASALALLNDGWQVVLAGRRREPLEAVAAESGAGDRAMPFSADVSDAGATNASLAAMYSTNASRTSENQKHPFFCQGLWLKG